MAAKKKTPPTQKKKVFGGMTGKAESALKGRGSRLAQQECRAMGGKWVGGKCKY